MKINVIEIKEPSVFFFTKTDKPIKILDDRGVLFHYIEKQTGNKFTLPKGRYTIIHDNNVEYIGKHFYEPQILPPERNIPFKLKKIVPVPNYQPLASIFYYTGTILMDKRLLSAPLPMVYAVFYHEMGHRYYQSENKCDHYSAQMMLRDGFNASQIYAAFGSTLYSEFRKTKLYNHLIHHKL